MSKIKDLKYYQKKANEYNKLETDLERLNYLKENQEDFLVLLDNDGTFVVFKNIKELTEEQEQNIKEINLNNFDEYNGSNEWNLILFKFAGIEAEFV